MQKKFLVATSDISSDSTTESVSELLRHARTLLNMEIAFVSEFVHGWRVFRHVEAASNSSPVIEAGQSNPLEETYCQRVVDGRIPLAIPNTHLISGLKELDVTDKLKIRAYLAAPIILADGRIYGSACCISHQVRTTLGSKQVDALRTIAELVAIQVRKSLTT
jgi:GAF domain-containing protein